MMFANMARFTYNECVGAVNRNEHRANKMTLRNAFVTKKSRDGGFNEFVSKRRWLTRTPKTVRQQAVFEAAKNFKAAFANLRNGNIDHFDVSFKTKKDQVENGYVIGIEKQVKFADGKLTILPETIGEVRFFEKPPIVNVPEAECCVQRDKYGDHWLLVPIYKTARASNLGPVVAIDPGIRTPFATFSPNGDGELLGVEMNDRLKTMQARISLVDRRISKTPKTDHVRRHKLTRYRKLMFRKHKRIRDDCHWKIINDLTDRYGGVLLPPLPVQELCQKLRAKTTRTLLGISHYTFRQRMAQKCEEKSALYVEPTEEYTSMTCGNCGRLNRRLGCSEVFWCDHCELEEAHRDLHAARNIYLKWMTSRRDAMASAAFVPPLPATASLGDVINLMMELWVLRIQ